MFGIKKIDPVDANKIVGWFLNQEKHIQDALLTVLIEIRSDEEYAISLRHLQIPS